VLWNALPHDWDDQDGWIDRALSDIDRLEWSVVVLHDVVDAALPRLDEFLTAVATRQPTWSQEFPDACTPIRNGVATASFDTLCIVN
jgi:hypothetical protein